MRKRGLVVVLAFAALVGGLVILPNRLYYRNRRPTRLGRTTNRAMSWLATLGAPLLATLEVRGRHSGRTVSSVVVPAIVNGDEYLVSMLGERSDWVHNVRAAGGEAVIRHGGRRRVRLMEVPVEQRAPVLKAYLHRAPGGRPHFPVDKDAPLDQFEAIAGDYPVFRVANGAR